MDSPPAEFPSTVLITCNQARLQRYPIDWHRLSPDGDYRSTVKWWAKTGKAASAPSDELTTMRSLLHSKGCAKRKVNKLGLSPLTTVLRFCSTDHIGWHPMLWLLGILPPDLCAAISKNIRQQAEADIPVGVINDERQETINTMHSKRLTAFHCKVRKLCWRCVSKLLRSFKELEWRAADNGKCLELPPPRGRKRKHANAPENDDTLAKRACKNSWRAQRRKREVDISDDDGISISFGSKRIKLENGNSIRVSSRLQQQDPIESTNDFEYYLDVP